MGAVLEEPAFHEIPHKHTCEADEKQTDRKKNRRARSRKPNCYQCLQDREMNDIHAIGKIPIFRKVSEITPKAANENNPRYPENVENASREPMIEKKQTRRDSRYAAKMEFQLVKIQE
jgi:hypothetical protein